MKKLRFVLLAVVVSGMAGCSAINSQYIKADKKTYEFLQPEIQKNIIDNTNLSIEYRQATKSVVDSWKYRLDKGIDYVEGK